MNPSFKKEELVLALDLAVGVEAEGGQSIALDRARLVDSLVDGGAVFSGGLISQVFVRYTRHFDVQIDAVKQRST